MSTEWEVALDGSFDWLVLGIGYAMLILFIFRMGMRKVVMTKLSSDFLRFRLGRKY